MTPALISYRLLVVQIMLLVIFFRQSYSQEEKFNEAWRLVRFTTESGLPSNHVFDVIETQSGTVWASTTHGVVWYNGFRWQLIDSSLGLPQEFPYRLTTDHHGRILTVINKHLYRGNEHGFKLITSGNIIDIAPFLEDDILINMNSSLYLFHNDTICLFKPSLQITKEKTSFLLITSGKSIWIMTTSGIYRWESSDWVCKISTTSYPTYLATLDENRNGDGIASVGLPGHYMGLLEWHSSSKPQLISDYKPFEVRSLALNNNEAIFLLRSGDIKIRRNGNWHSFTLIDHKLTNIERVKYGSNGDIWIPTGDGLYLYRRSLTRWEYINHRYPDPGNSITEIYQKRNGDLWIGSADGLEIRKKDGSEITMRQINNTRLYTMTGICEDNQANMWISSGGSFEGVFRWDGISWTHEKISNDSDGVMIHKIRKDREGRLWFLGLSKKQIMPGVKQPGAFVYENGKFTRWGTAEGLINGRVYAFAEDTNGCYWFGTYGGLSRWTPSKSEENNRDGTWKHWTEHEGLRREQIFTLAVDHNNQLWFGDRLRGLGYIDENDQAHYLTTEDGLVSDEIWDITIDNNNKIWATTPYGVSCYNKNIFSNFDIKNGLSPTTCWPILATKDKIYIGTQGNGVAILNLPEINTPVPQIVIDKPVVEPDAALIRWKAFSFWQEEAPQDIQIRYRINNQRWSSWDTKRELTVTHLEPGNYLFEIQAKNLFGKFNTEAKQISFIVALPLHKHPFFLFPSGMIVFALIKLSISQYVNKRRHAAALQLSEAKFRRLTEATFEGIIIHDNGVILDANRSVQKMFNYDQDVFRENALLKFFAPESQDIIAKYMSFTSEPLYEATGIRKDGSKIFVEIMSKTIPYEDHTAMVMAIRDITERKRIEKQLQSLASELSFTEERERRQLASYLHDDIGQSLALCKIKLASILQVSHSKKVEEVQTILNAMIKSTQTLTFELSPPVLYELEFDDAVEWLGKQLTEQHHLPILVERNSEPKPLRQELRILLFNATRELLINAIKHANSQQATVTIRRVNEMIFICVHDDGKGFSPSTFTKRSTTGGGFGLFNIRERLKPFGGKLEIESHPQHGTKATLVAPLNLNIEPTKDQTHLPNNTSTYPNH